MPPERLLLLLQAAAALTMTGLIWFVQVVHYPLFDGVGPEHFADYEQRHQSRTTWVVVPPMLLEVATAVLLLWYRPTSGLLWTGAGLLAVIWLSTVLLQVPRHEELALGFQSVAHRFLVASNWLRTIAWSIRGVIALYLLR